MSIISYRFDHSHWLCHNCAYIIAQFRLCFYIVTYTEYPMKRRTFIVTAITVAAVASVPVIGNLYRRSRTGDPLLRPDVLSRFCDKETITEIGNHYLSCAPSEARKEKLRKLILTDDAGRKATSSDASSVYDWVNQRIRDDFSAKRTTIIDGWIISITEARQCALLSLTK